MKIDFNKKDNLAILILIILATGLYIGVQIDANTNQIPNFFKQVDKISTTNHILTDGVKYYYISPYNMTNYNYTNWKPQP